MDQQFLEREKELFKLNAKLNAKTKKQASKAASTKPVHIVTANNNFNYYEESPAPPAKESHDDGLELLCKKINITNQPTKKSHEIVYPWFNRQTASVARRRNLDIHMPGGSLISDGKTDFDENDATSIDINSETVESKSFRNESLMTRYSDDSSAVPPADPIPNLPMPPNLIDVIPKSMERKNICNDGLLK